MPKSSSKRGLVLVTGGSGYTAGYELIRPARDGTLRALKAARDAGVKRVA